MSPAEWSTVLLAGVTFVYVILTYSISRSARKSASASREAIEEMRKQLGEMRAQRDELVKTRMAQEEPVAALQAQVAVDRLRSHREQDAAVREHDLSLEILEISAGTNPTRFNFDNVGAPVRDVRIVPANNLTNPTVQRNDFWYPGPGWIDFAPKEPNANGNWSLHNFQFTAIYTNRLGQRRTRSFNVYVKERDIREIETVYGDHPDHLSNIGEWLDAFD